MIDIDEQFVRTAAKHLPTLNAGAFEDPRVTLLFADASKALLRYKGAFDVAIIDCNDAIGPSAALFEEDFYATVARSLADDGICAVQAGSMVDEEFLQQTHRRMTSQLGRTTGFRLTMPSYHCGEYVFLEEHSFGNWTSQHTHGLRSKCGGKIGLRPSSSAVSSAVPNATHFPKVYRVK